jgi:YwiC-like protein
LSDWGLRVEEYKAEGQKAKALPVEHGGWGISLEPVLLGLLVAPSPAGLWLALATLGAFLARRPLKIVAGDRRRGREFARTPVARRFVLLYGAVALACFVLLVLNVPNYLFLWPLALAAPRAGDGAARRLQRDRLRRADRARGRRRSPVRTVEERLEVRG